MADSVDRGQAQLDALTTVQPHNGFFLPDENGIHHPAVRLIKATEIQPEPIDWLWDGWLAAGRIHILGGSPATGKTTISLSLASILSCGGCWPDGSQSERGNVVIWSAEDDIRDTLVPRLIGVGANLEHIQFIGNVQDRNGIRTFDPAKDVEYLRRAIAKKGNVRLLIVDPIVSAVAGNSNLNSEVRRALQPLADLATDLRCAVIGITHFSKGTSGNDPLERITGSLAFGALARVVMITANYKAEDEITGRRRLLCRAKSNIGPDGDGFKYSLTPIELTGYPSVTTTTVTWDGAITGSAAELLATAESRPHEEDKLSGAKTYLTELLSAGPLPSTEIYTFAQRAGYSKATIRRAKEALDIKSSKKDMEGPWVWQLSGHEDAQDS
jgi:putative DNA primase/helicase